MKYLLDTNVYFSALHERGYLDRFRSLLVRIAPLTYLSSVVRFELLQGARGDLGRARVSRATRQLERTRRVVSPDHTDWLRAGTAQGQIWDDHPALRSKGLQNDILLACTARRIGAVVVTENAGDFNLIARYLPHRALSPGTLAQELGLGPAPG